MKAYIQKIAYYFPARCLTNEEVSKEHPEWSAEKISLKTGIDKRYVSASNETALDMAEKASLRLFEIEKVDRRCIDYVILCTQSPDYILPTSACILQDRLGLDESCGAFDYNLGCSGFVYGLGIAKGLIISEQAKNVLLITSETYSKYLHPEDKSCQTIFGDGAAATLISHDLLQEGMNLEILRPAYRTIGNHYQDLIVTNGAARNPQRGMAEDQKDSVGDFVKNDDFLYMDGKEIFNFSANIVPELVLETLMMNNLTRDDVSKFIFHQANKFMLNFSRVKCGIPIDKFVYDLEDGGNTVSSTIPIALKRKINVKNLEFGSSLLLCGFGVGLSACCIILIKQSI